MVSRVCPATVVLLFSIHSPAIDASYIDSAINQNAGSIAELFKDRHSGSILLVTDDHKVYWLPPRTLQSQQNVFFELDLKSKSLRGQGLSLAFFLVPTEQEGLQGLTLEAKRPSPEPWAPLQSQDTSADGFELNLRPAESTTMWLSQSPHCTAGQPRSGSCEGDVAPRYFFEKCDNNELKDLRHQTGHTYFLKDIPANYRIEGMYQDSGSASLLILTGERGSFRNKRLFFLNESGNTSKLLQTGGWQGCGNESITFQDGAYVNRSFVPFHQLSEAAVEFKAHTWDQAVVLTPISNEALPKIAKSIFPDQEHLWLHHFELYSPIVMFESGNFSLKKLWSQAVSIGCINRHRVEGISEQTLPINQLSIYPLGNKIRNYYIFFSFRTM